MNKFKDGDMVKHKKDGTCGTVNTFHPPDNTTSTGYYVIDWDDNTSTGEFEQDIELYSSVHFMNGSSVLFNNNHNDTWVFDTDEFSMTLPECDCGTKGAPNTQAHSRWCKVYKKEF